MEQVGTNQVARAASVIVAISTVGMLLAFVREQFVASYFGATDLTDAYLTAWLVPQVVAGIMGEAIGLAFLPVFVSYLARDKADAWALASAVIRWVVIILLVVSVLCFIGAPVIVNLLVPNFTPEQQSLTVSMLRILLSGVVIMGMASLLNSLLHSHREFAWPALAPLAFNLATITCMAVLAGRLGIASMVWANLTGLLVQLALLLGRIKHNRFPLWQKGRLWHPGLSQVSALALPIIVGFVFSEVYLFLEKTLASGLEAGSIAALHYAGKISYLPSAIFVTALATAIYPSLARSAISKDSAGLASSVTSGIRLLSLVTFPAAVGLLVLRTPIVTLTYERGRFDGSATAMTATALAFYSIGIVGSANRQVIVRAFYALRDSLTPLKVSACTALLNMLLALLLVGPLGHGGLALAHSLTMLCNMIVLFILLRKRLDAPLDFAGVAPKIAGAAAVMGILCHFAHNLMQSYLGPVKSFVVSVMFAGVIYFTLLALLGVEELRQLFSILQSKTQHWLRIPLKQWTQIFVLRNRRLKPLVVIGVGGVGKGVYQIVQDINAIQPTWDFLGFLDDNKDLHGKVFFDKPVLGDTDWLHRNPDMYVVVAVADPYVRLQVSHRLRRYSRISFPTLVHPSAWLADDVFLGAGCLIYPGALINASVTLGEQVIVNMRCSIGHDAQLADFVTLAPGVSISGGAILSQGVDVGANAVVLQLLTIDRWTKIGAGAVVISSMPSNITCVGVPARVVRIRAPVHLPLESDLDLALTHRAVPLPGDQHLGV